MINYVSYTSYGSSVAIAMTDGTVWNDDAALPADTDTRRQLADWIKAGNKIVPFVPATPNIEDLRNAAKAKIDGDAETYRLTFITGGAGQAMAYQQKLEEAKAYLADASLTAIECPHIFAEIGITGETSEAVAKVVVGMHAAWQTKSAEIERKRLAAKAAIDEATTAEAITAIAAVAWKTEGSNRG